MAVVKNTPMSAIFLPFGSSTATIEAAVITSKLNAADPTIVNGPSSDAGSPLVLIVSIRLSKISGAEEPRAISVRFAIVAFQTGTSILAVRVTDSPSPGLPGNSTSSYTVFEVMTSIASMKISATIAIPKNSQIRKIKVDTAKRPGGNN